VGKDQGGSPKSDISFALGKELLARYEGVEVIADKPNARSKILYESAAEFMRGDSSSASRKREIAR